MTSKQASKAPELSVRCVILSVEEHSGLSLKGGQVLAELLKKSGHEVMEHLVVPDQATQVSSQLVRVIENDAVQAAFFCGESSLSIRDNSYDVIGDALDRVLPGFGELVRAVVYEKRGAEALCVQAIGGFAGRKLVLAMPGDPNIVKAAAQMLILPQLPALIRSAN